MAEGVTLLINIYDASTKSLSSEDIIGMFLFKCVRDVGMTPVPNTYKAVSFPIFGCLDYEGEVGISAGMILIESHIYIHTWTEEGYARLELSSCKKIDPEPVFKLIEYFFGDNVKYDYKLIDWSKNEVENDFKD